MEKPANPADRNDDEVMLGREHENLQGWAPELTNDDALRMALDKAFDYRGDITIRLKDGRKIEGYVFDRRVGETLEGSLLRIIPITSTTKLSIPYADICGLEFSGKDTAAGKSFESWVAKYWAKKAAGEKDIQNAPEVLD